MTVGQSRVLFSLPYHFLSDSLCALDFKHPSVSGDFQMLFPSLAFSLNPLQTRSTHEPLSRWSRKSVPGEALLCDRPHGLEALPVYYLI